jgi:hypothetical protein
VRGGAARPTEASAENGSPEPDAAPDTGTGGR